MKIFIHGLILNQNKRNTLLHPRLFQIVDSSLQIFKKFKEIIEISWKVSILHYHQLICYTNIFVYSYIKLFSLTQKKPNSLLNQIYSLRSKPKIEKAIQKAF